MHFGSAPPLFGREGGEGELGRVEDGAGLFNGDGIDEDAVGGAGDEVADVFAGGKQGQSFAKCLGRDLFCPEGRVRFELKAFFLAGFVGAPPGGHAALDGGQGAFEFEVAIIGESELGD